MPLDARAAKIREMFLSLPDAHEVIKWGTPHLCVGEKILGGVDVHEGRVLLSCKLEMSHALARVADDPRFEPAKYVGKHGWITMDATTSDDWEEIRALVLEGYRLVAPKKSLAKMVVSSSPRAPARSPAPGPRRRASSGSRTRR